MNYKKHGSSLRRFDSSSESALTAALKSGNCVDIHLSVAAGGRHENRRDACREIAERVLRKLGEFPLMEEGARPSSPHKSPPEITLHQVLNPTTESEPSCSY